MVGYPEYKYYDVKRDNDPTPYWILLAGLVVAVVIQTV